MKDRICVMHTFHHRTHIIYFSKLHLRHINYRKKNKHDFYACAAILNDQCSVCTLVCIFTTIIIFYKKFTF